MINRIIVICTGNICRSPSAEYLLKSRMPEKHITSAGLYVEKNRLAGRPADEMASLVAAEHGIDLSSHQAQQLTAQHYQDHDLILVMEQHHLDVITRQHPQLRGRVMRFGYWLNDIDIPDPFKQSREAYDHVWDLLERSTDQWVKHL